MSGDADEQRNIADSAAVRAEDQNQADTMVTEILVWEPETRGRQSQTRLAGF